MKDFIVKYPRVTFAVTDRAYYRYQWRAGKFVHISSKRGRDVIPMHDTTRLCAIAEWHNR